MYLLDDVPLEPDFVNGLWLVISNLSSVLLLQGKILNNLMGLEIFLLFKTPQSSKYNIINHISKNPKFQFLREDIINWLTTMIILLNNTKINETLALKMNCDLIIGNSNNNNNIFPTSVNIRICGAPDCFLSSASSSSLLLCGGCKSISYCSKEHQKQHWKDHKPNCKKK